MTDEQLRAALRRIIEAAGFHESNNGYRIDIDTFNCESGLRIYVKQNVTVNADEWEAAAVAILREELAKCPRCTEYPPAAETCRTLHDLCPEHFDDPTKSFVATT